jgi:hypothetical protein
MGISLLPYRYRINGVLSTDATVMQNMETLSRAAQSWFTYDVTQGKWAVIINTTGNSIASFDDSNITGPVSISGTGLSDLYNRVRVEFPHVDLDDQVDFVEIAIPPEDRNSNEPDNTLNISFDVINDPVMAEMLGLIELKQSRVDRVIKFTTDYSYIGLKAGDLIDVTNTVLGFTNKVFRIISLEEADDEAISISITATEYDANVYDVSDLFRFERSNENGIVTKGAIDPPTTPIITAYEQTARPGVDIETTVPSGIVEKIEFWYSTDDTNFILVGTESPSGGGTYEFADTVIFNYDKFDAAGNVFAKCRAVNSTTASEYSPTASLIGFAPVQVTDALDNNTEILDDSGSPIAKQLGLSALMGGLDFFLDGNDDMGQVVTENVEGQLSGNDVQSVAFTSETIAESTVISILNAAATTSNDNYVYDGPTTQDNPISSTITVPAGYDRLTIEVKTPVCSMDYEMLDQGNTVQTMSIFAQPAFLITVNTGNTVVGQSTIDWNSNYNKLVVPNPGAGDYTVRMIIIPTYDLNMFWTRPDVGIGQENYIYFYNFVGTGGSSTVDFDYSLIKQL